MMRVAGEKLITGGNAPGGGSHRFDFCRQPEHRPVRFQVKGFLWLN
jgi:hypothetical protein